MVAILGDSSAAAHDAVATKQLAGDFMIKPDASGAQLNTEQWPLLLKGYVSVGERGVRFLLFKTRAI